jgi:aconitate hydratase
VPVRDPLDGDLEGEVLIMLGDNISTDHILPAGAHTLALRSNVPAISEYVFHYLDRDFVRRAKEKDGGVIVAASNYGQGSSREHAAIGPMYLGVTIVLAKSFARIHRDNLVNYGILPLTFADESDYDALDRGHVLSIAEVASRIEDGAGTLMVSDVTGGTQIKTNVELSERQRRILVMGGLLTYASRSAA